MKRREFLGVTLATGGTLAGCNMNNSTQGSNPSEITKQRDERFDTSAQRNSLYERIEKQIEQIPAFNNHFHPGEGFTVNSFDWYFTGEIITASNPKSRAVLQATSQLLDTNIEGRKTEEVRKIHGEYYKGRTARDYYTKLADITNTSHIVFMSEHWNPEEKKLDSERMLLVPYASHWIFPLDNTVIKKRHEWSDLLVKQREVRLKKDEQNFGKIPASFQGYLDFVDRAIEQYRQTPNVVGLKWGLAYWRTLDVQLVTKDEAKRVYESQDSSPEPYKKLQDYLIYHILKKCAQMELPLQIHSGLGAGGGCLVMNESNASLLDLLFSQAEFDNARVTCLHGSYPYCKELGVVARRKNVWLDFSWMPLLLEPQELAGYLKEWIQIAGVHKLLFGIDGAGLAQVVGTWCTRKALSIALTQLIQEGLYNEQQAINTAKAILQKNALNFYKLT